MNESRDSIVVGENLTRTYRLGSTLVKALEGVDFSVGRGDFIVVQGPSGSGKTTLINLLGLLDQPDSGRVLLDGRSVTTLRDDELADLRRDRIGFVFQSFSLVPVLTAAENVAYPMVLKGLARDEIRRRTGLLLDRVGLADRASSRPDHLSGGQRQRVAIARALANEPDLILADEPTANLDSAGAADMLDLMRDLNGERQVAFVIATHDPRVVARARRTVTLHDGRLTTPA